MQLVVWVEFSKEKNGGTFMKRLLLPSVAVLAVSIGVYATAGNAKPGLEVGAFCGAFTVQDITGPNKPRSLCYR